MDHGLSALGMLRGEIMERKQITLRLPYELYELVKKEAERLGLDIKSLITVYLWSRFEPDSIVPK